jgi:hypothetical protein
MKSRKTKARHPSAGAGDSKPKTDGSNSPAASPPAAHFLLLPQLTPFVPRVECDLHTQAKEPDTSWCGFFNIRSGRLLVVSRFGRS